MQCAKCSFDNTPEAKFCVRCGEPLKAAPPAPPAPSGGGEAVPQGLKIGIMIASFFIPLLGIIMGAIYMNDPNPEKKKVGRLWLYVALGAIALGCVCWVAVMAVGSANRGYNY